jgi:tetratricopeptide (TPR) repeat protein
MTRFAHNSRCPRPTGGLLEIRLEILLELTMGVRANLNRLSWKVALVHGALVFGLGALGLLTGCEGIQEVQDQAEDDEARAGYFESAAVTYYDGGRYDLAEVQFRKVLVLEPDNKKAKRGLAKSLYQQGTAEKLTEAQVIFEEIVHYDWPNPGGTGNRRYEVQTDLALTYSDIADLYDRAAHNIGRRFKIDPDSDNPAMNATLRKQIEKRNEYLLKATPVFQRVLQASPDNPYALAGLAKAHLQLGNDELGINYARRYLVLSQRSQVAWRQGLETWEERAGGAARVTDEVRRDFQRRIQGAREKEKKMHLMLASVHMRRGEYGAAADQYTEVIKLDSTVPAAYVERAQAFGQLGQYQRAVADLEEYLKITDPTRHRDERLNAVDLMNRYEMAIRRGDQAPPPAPAPRPAARPAPAGAGGAWGSPDG